MRVARVASRIDDMFRESSSDVSEFMDVALSFINTLTEQATETVTKRTFSNQKPWMDRTIHSAVNQRNAAYNAGLLSGNISEYKALCYALRQAARATKLRERIESHFQLNDSWRMWQGLRTSSEVRADPLLADELNSFYGRFECKRDSATLPISASGRHQQTSSCESRPVHLKLDHPERRIPTGLCPESPAIFSLHKRLLVFSQLHFYYQIC